MAADILERDADIRFPHFTVLKASAGSGKTHTIMKRFVQFLLSGKIPRNRLRNARGERVRSTFLPLATALMSFAKGQAEMADLSPYL